MKIFKIPWRLKLILIVALISVFALTPLISAQSLPDDRPLQCQLSLRSYLNTEGGKFMSVLNGHFQNASSTTSLIPSANSAYTKYKDQIRLELVRLKSTLPAGMTQTRQLEEVNACDKELNDHIFMMDNVIKAHVQSMSSAKRNFAMIEQYQHINEKLYGMNRELGQVKGYFKAFETKLEAFVPKCAQ